jgi:hypothetical protein
VVSSDKPLISESTIEFGLDRQDVWKKQVTFQVVGVFFVNDVGKITAIVKNHVEGLAARECSNRLLDTPSVFLLGFTFPSKDGHTSRSNTVSLVNIIRSCIQMQDYSRSGSVVLCGEDVLKYDAKMKDRSRAPENIRILHKMTRQLQRRAQSMSR